MHYRTTIYFLFFFSGLSALIYQILWVRLFSLVFGGSHMAVTTVLAVFMGGLALGGHLGRHTDRHPRPLKMYGHLEIGIGAAAILVFLLLHVYPNLYVAFARLSGTNLTILTVGRVIFAVVALLLPTTLMGLTLPVLSCFADRRAGNFGKHLSCLYGINTFGAVAGALAAGFFLLRHLTVTATYGLAVAVSLLIGLASLLLDRAIAKKTAAYEKVVRRGTPLETSPLSQLRDEELVPAQLILIGIGISGFCALGYEILWTRVLSIVVGTTVYGYTLMLVAFLIGIAAGGASYRLLLRFSPGEKIGGNIDRSVFRFGLVQIGIGLLAILVSFGLRDLPYQALIIEAWIKGWLNGGTNILQTTNFVMAVIYMLPPAFLMGLAFPIAGDIVARSNRRPGKAAGETLTYNTVGAILGAAVSGFVLIFLFGIERSLQYLFLLNLGLGLTVCASRLKPRIAVWSVPPIIAGLMLMLYVQPDLLRFWDKKYFAIFNHNARQYLTTEERREAVYETTDVLYYAEGTTSTISVVKLKGVNQGINVNGRTVASTSKQDLQCQYTLGHLPMLLHKNPRKVWVLGMGTGITAGATTVHQDVESVTVVELEEHVVPAARTFAADNHHFLDNPKVEVVFNDGRNFLLTTTERYDVITADPIHPWSQGAAYLYTDEYYRLAASRLNKGGVMCQWLPIYELTPRDLQSVVRTFSKNFRYVYVWLTDSDAELIGSNEPIEIDIAALQKRIENSPQVLADLKRVNMGSAAEFLSYAIMGPAASRLYGTMGPLNTDENLYLEFSAPDSKGKAELIPVNIRSLSQGREDISPYLAGGSLSAALGGDSSEVQHAAKIYDLSHQMRYQGAELHPIYKRNMNALINQFPWYAPGRYLYDEYQFALSRIPQLIDETRLTLVEEDGTPAMVTLSAVSSKIGPERAKLLIVDNRVRKIYGNLYLDGPAGQIDLIVKQEGKRLLQLIDSVYRQEKPATGYPDQSATLEKISTAIGHFEAREI